MTADLAQRYRVQNGKGFSLSDIDPADRGGNGLDKAKAKPLLEAGLKELVGLQERLYAEHRWALLIILQGMDTSGKDGVVKHVMAGVNPLGCMAHAFKAPSRNELDHGFLWRSQMLIPGRGHIGIFNRSYYEDVLAVRFREVALAEEGLPPSLVTDDIWERRFGDIRAFETYLGNVGIVPIKVMLHISPGEQKKRLLARADDPGKHWKFNAADLDDRRLWKPYHSAYEDAIRRTATATAPWYVVPSDHKWFSRLVVASITIDTLKGLDLHFPEQTKAGREAMEAARRQLLAE
ncbi:MAG: polyphosphate kinase 2 family protein [Candidatus Devosia phytovorans]|uniref:Polyphosphate kinase 2 family protein n=1 Tax=Candidatus Devosia phytovorans TaxID=3121372 RepID=A0AAJ5VUE0_9HYPH|nr:PPK2 family polyphosphate kinase [Devosia sp.]WEK04360.1 MAG: polyphosphate kinase 2 family protein [Devosia sp.]